MIDNQTYNIRDAIEEGNLSWTFLSEHEYSILENEDIQLRVVVASLLDSGDELIFEALKSTPGAYVHEYPMSRMSFRPLGRPDTPDATFAAETLLELSNCNHSKIHGKSTFSRNYWYEDNVKFHLVDCILKRKANICLHPLYLSGVCLQSPVQILRVNTDVFHGLNFGRLLYDPWTSKSLKIVAVFRDPRGIWYQRKQNPRCNAGCQDPGKICSRLSATLRAAFQFQKFSPDHFM